MAETLDQLSTGIIAPLAVQKLAGDIISPCMEKEAASGITEFGKALSGSKIKSLKAETEQLGKQLAEKASNQRLNDRYNEVKKLEGTMENASVHNRMNGVKENLEHKMDHYKDVSKSNDDTLNWYTGIRTPLRAVSPGYWKAKASNFVAKQGVRNAKSQYRGQEQRIKKDVAEELSVARNKYTDAKKELGINGLHEQLANKQKELSHAQSATRSARTATGLGVAGVGGAAYYKNKKNDSGPYTYPMSSQASEENDYIEKLSQEIVQCMYEK